MGALLGFTANPSRAASVALGSAISCSDSLTLAEIKIQRRNIFSAEEERRGPFLVTLPRRLMNRLHFTTRKSVIYRELLFQPGDPFQPSLLAETERNLRTLGFLNDISVVAVDTTPGGLVTVLVDTRDSWTLKTEATFTQASGGDRRWSMQFSDSNFMGYGTTMGVGVGGDENANYWNFWYRQRRFLGTPLWLGVDDREREDGHIRSVFLNRPFWGQGDRWNVESQYWDRVFTHRYYLSNAGPAGLEPGREISLYTLLPLGEKGLEINSLLRLHGHHQGRIWRLGGGARWNEAHYDLDPGEHELSDGRMVGLDWLADPSQPLGRDNGTTVWPYLRVQTLGRGWTKDRFILQYGTIEDLNLTPSVDLKVGPETGLLGTTTAGGQDRWRAEGAWNQWVVSGPGLILLQGQGQVVWGDATAAFHQYTLLAGWIGNLGSELTPWSTRVFGEYGHGKALAGTNSLVLGLVRGLRTLEFDGMAGDRLARLTVEEGKVLPGEILSMFRYGVGVFYAEGSAWWHGEERGLNNARHELGFGLRFGPTRSAKASTGRIDLVWDVQNGGTPVITATTRGFF